MAQPHWITTPGSIGIFPTSIPLTYSLIASTSYPSGPLTYILLNGSLPEGTDSDPMILSSSGVLTGTPKPIKEQTTFVFTVRATDSFGNIRDGVFSIDIVGTGVVTLTQPNGQLMNVFDSIYVDFKLGINDYNGLLPYTAKISSGELPQGLQLDATGRITGYPAAPYLDNGSPTTKTYNFSIQLVSELGTSSGQFYIVVRNQYLSKAAHTIKPALLNTQPLSIPISDTDPYNGYYLLGTTNLGTFNSGDYFNFKFIGHDFEDDPIGYSFGSLPPGLVGNTTTGWITGTPILDDGTIMQYAFTVAVFKTIYPNVISQIHNFTMRVSNDVSETIVWNTDGNLGSLFNGETSNLYVDATATKPLSYEIVSGSLPSNLELLSNGSIIGRVAFEPETTLTPLDTKLTYTFSVMAYMTNHAIVNSTKEFTITVDMKYLTPTENIYFKATPDLAGRQVINSLLDNADLIPYDYLYRPEDPYYGKSQDVRVVMSYGIKANTLQNYLTTLDTNFYNRKIILGEIKTAIATNLSGEILYEVVYAEVVDPLITPDGVSIPDRITWPRRISLDEGDFYTTNTDLYVTSGTVYTSDSPGYTNKLYPGSVENMRNKVISTLPYDSSQDWLPAWMTSQQSDGSTIGFKQVWVICYTKPGKAAVIRNNIYSYWSHRLNEIDFSLDRFLVDKSATFNFNLNPGTPSWSTLPGGVPPPEPMNTYDLPVLFPRTNILPNSNN
jgi:hypothetical protein